MHVGLGRVEGAGQLETNKQFVWPEEYTRLWQIES